MHPLTGEDVSLNDAVRRGFVDAQIFEDQSEGFADTETKRFDARLPVAAFGIDKRITCMRTKFNKDGTSLLQVEIESLRPTRGIYEMDEVDDFSSGSMQSSTTRSATHEYRQVVDINSVHHIKEAPSVSFIEPVVQSTVRTERNFQLKQADRVEKVIDDDQRGKLEIGTVIVLNSYSFRQKLVKI